MTVTATRSTTAPLACAARAGTPLANCRPHEIDAARTDRLALWLLAKALTDPEDILALADAAEARQAEAEAEATLADAALAAHSQELARLDAQAESVRTALRALAAVPGVEAQVAGLREQLTRLDDEREAVLADHTRAIPQPEHAHDRQAFLRRLFTVRDEVINWRTLEMHEEGEPHLSIPRHMSLRQAAALLGTTEDALMRSKLPKSVAFEEDDTTYLEVDTRHVVYQMLKRAGRDEVRQLLRNLEAVVVVSHPRPRAEWRTFGPLPLAERVQLVVLGQVEVRTDAANVSRFS